MRIIGLAACFAGVLAQAQSVPDSAGMAAALSSGMRMLAPAQFVLDHRTELGLTPVQVSRVESLVRAHADSVTIRMQRRMSVTRPTTRAETGFMSWSGPIDESAIRESARRASEGQAQLLIDIARDRRVVGAVLTADQLSVLPRLEFTDMRKSMRGPRAMGTMPAKGGVYFEFQVEKQVQQIAGTGGLTYPGQLRSAKVEGEVLAQFVVDTNGVYEHDTFKVLKSTHELFTAAVRDALPVMRFTPAEVGGVKVRQLVQQPFIFALPRNE